jgi:hypothetical protein
MQRGLIPALLSLVAGRVKKKGLSSTRGSFFAAVVKACFFLKAGDVSVSFRIWGFGKNECI